ERIANKEDGSVVAGHIPVAFFGVELEREAAGIALGVSGTFFAADSGEAEEGGSLLADGAEEFCGGEFGDFGSGANEVAVSAGALGVDNAFGDAFAVEVSHFFEEQEIFEYDGTARSYGERVLVVADGTARIGSHMLTHGLQQTLRPDGFFVLRHFSSKDEPQRGAATSAG